MAIFKDTRWMLSGNFYWSVTHNGNAEINTGVIGYNGKYVNHAACEKTNVWDWPVYKGGACYICERAFKQMWDQWMKYLSINQNYFLWKCGVGKRHRSCTIHNFDGPYHARQTLRAIIDNPSDCVLTGPPGTGKTHLAAAILWGMVLSGAVFKLENEHPRATFITVPDLLNNIRASFHNRKSEDEYDEVKFLSYAPFLFLDDLGAEKSSEWATSTIYSIIDARYREELPTIVTTNLSLPEISEKLDPRIASRLSSGKIIQLTGPDRRWQRANT